MDFIKKNLKNILLFGGILAAFYAGYSYLSSSKAPVPTTALVASGPGAPVGGGTGADLLALLLDLRSLRLDGAVFSDPVFQSLKNFGVTIPPETVGRPNPFAPLPGSAVPTGPVISIGSAKK